MHPLPGLEYRPHSGQMRKVTLGGDGGENREKEAVLSAAYTGSQGLRGA